MSNELMNFLVEVGNDVNKKTAYLNDPGRCLSTAGLSDEEIQLLIRGDERELSFRINEKHCESTWIFVFN